jgi:hypothetical protein
MASPRVYLIAVATVVLLGLGAVWVYVTSFPMAFLEAGYPIWVAKQQFIKDCDLGDVAVFGDSRVEAGLMAKGSPEKITLLGFGGTTPIETYFAIKHALNCNKLPKRIVLAHGAGQFSRKPVLLWENAVRYRYISFSEAREINQAASTLKDPSIDQIKTRDGLTGIARDLLYASSFPAIYFNSLYNADLFGRLDKNEVTLAQTRDLRGHVPYPPHHDGDPMLGEEALLSSFKPMPTSDYFFEKTLQLLKARNIETDWISLPITETSSESLKPGFRDEFGKYLQRYSVRYPNFHVVLILPPWPDKFFSNKDHLDEAGAAIFSGRFSECMKQRIAAARARMNAPTCNWSWNEN